MLLVYGRHRITIGAVKCQSLPLKKSRDYVGEDVSER